MGDSFASSILGAIFPPLGAWQGFSDIPSLDLSGIKNEIYNFATFGSPIQTAVGGAQTFLSGGSNTSILDQEAATVESQIQSAASSGISALDLDNYDAVDGSASGLSGSSEFFIGLVGVIVILALILLIMGKVDAL